MTDTIVCPGNGEECGKEFDSTQAFNAHWGQKHDGPTPDSIDTSLSEEHKKRIGESNEGKESHMKGKTHSGKTKQRISKSVEEFHEENEHPLKGESLGPLSEEHKEKISESLSGRTLSDKHIRKIVEARKESEFSEETKRSLAQNLDGHRMKGEIGPYDWYYIPELDRKVQGTWERDFAEMLCGCIDPDTIECQVQFNYCVDFVIEDSIVVEVKGWFKRGDYKKGQNFLEEYGDDYVYVVVGGDGTDKIPCHHWIDWSERGKFWKIYSHYQSTH